MAHDWKEMSDDEKAANCALEEYPITSLEGFVSTLKKKKRIWNYPLLK
jgi:hypothetical protein